ncbi:MAG: succinate dehydrogenase [Oligoflexia bacterium]|nr:succinate dehydrogenase [Oligoflexia bacterium]
MSKSFAKSSLYFNYFFSSIGKKQVLAVTATFLCLFTIVHFIGNLLMFAGPQYFNWYGHTLASGPLLPLAEGLLLLLFLSHASLGLWLACENYRARPERYYKKVRSGRGATFASATMPFTGILLLFFLVLHLLHFRFGPVYTIVYDGVEMRDFYRLMIEFYANPLNVVLYLLSMCLLSFHLGHGVQSIFQSYGWIHSKYTPWVKRMGLLIAVFLAIGFSSFPLWAYLKHGVVGY